ncbi:hypothetical protein E4U15_007621 [Claviceps sp. LM218 group G6]|nr:hypothetical protein E4U15_007621 [Claviceps sp. LM218 group G6]
MSAMRCIKDDCRGWSTSESVFCVEHKSADQSKSQQKKELRQAIDNIKSTALAQDQKKK